MSLFELVAILLVLTATFGWINLSTGLAAAHDRPAW